MKIEYKFVDGTMTEIEVDGSLGEFMLELKKEGDRVERKETRRHMSLDSMDFEGELFASAEDTEETAIFREDMGQLMRALDMLSPEQRELVLKVYFKGMRIVDIARKEGVGESAVRDRIRRIHKKMKKYLE